MTIRFRVTVAVLGLVLAGLGGYLFWAFDIHARHPSSYSMWEIAILPTALVIGGVTLAVLAAGGDQDVRRWSPLGRAR